MEAKVDATDQLETNHPPGRTSGIAPQLAALEMLLYPSSAQVIINTALLLAGTIEILPPTGPMTVLVWGPGRAIPVRVASLTITEEAFDQALFPIRASVQIALRVLTYSDLPSTDPGHALFLVHQVLKETMASIAGTSGSIASAAQLTAV